MTTRENEQENETAVVRSPEETLEKNRSTPGDEPAAPPPASPPVGGETEYQRLIALWTAFPDLTFTLVKIAAKGAKVVVRLAITGTHRGTFMEIPPTGKRVEISGVFSHQLENGQPVEAGSSFLTGLEVLLQQILQQQDGPARSAAEFETNGFTTR